MTATIYIRLKRGTAASFTAANPVLEAGQPAYETDTRKLKVGDGSTAWVSLAYISTPGTISDGDKGDITASSLGAVWTIDNGAVTLAKQANVASGTLFYRKTVGAGAPEVQTLATLKTDLALGLSDVSGLTAALAAKQPLDGDLTSLAAAAGTNDIYYRSAADTWSPVAIGANLTFTAGTLAATGGGGVSDGDKGDITVSGVGTVWTIDNGVVTLAKMADMATASLVYRKTAGTGVPEVQTLATLKTDLGLTGTNSGDQTITLTGEVTGSGTGSFATTIAAGAVTYAKMQATALGNVFLGKSGAAGTITEIQLGLNNLVGRGSSGNLTTITLDATLAFTGGVLGVVAGTYVTVSGFDAAVAATPAVTANTAKVTNANHTGDATGSGALTLATVNANVGSFGSATQIPTFTVNAKGLTTAAADVAIAIPASQVTDFSEAVDDRVAALLVQGNGITLTYNDGANTLTVSDGWTYVRLTSDETSILVTNTATALTFTPAANKRYELEIQLLVQSAATTTGPRFAITWPTGLTDSASSVIGLATSAVATLTSRFLASQDTSQVATTGCAVVDTSYLDLIKGMVTTGGSPSGAFTVQIATEVSLSAVKFMAGSFLKYREIP